MNNDDLKIIVPENFREFGIKVNNHINNIRNNYEEIDYVLPIDLIRFNNGEGKALIRESVRNKDSYIITDCGNYDVSYLSQRGVHYMGPDEHFMDIIRILGAASGHAKKITLFMPLLYQSRQDKKSDRESLDCAMALQELERLKVEEFITFDAHNPAVYNAIPTTPFENFYATDDLLVTLLENEKIAKNDIVVVAPDEGATNRARVFADFLGNVNMGVFYKQRDYSILVDGHHPIVAHRFLGNEEELEGKTAIIVDDILASGNSIIDTAKQLKERKVDKVYLVVTFALFSKGIDKIKEAYEKGYFDKIYATNLTYVPKEIVDAPWFHIVDCSKKVAYIVNALNEGSSIKPLLNGKVETVKKIKTLRK